MLLDLPWLVEINRFASMCLGKMPNIPGYVYTIWLRRVPPCQALSYFRFSHLLYEILELVVLFQFSGCNSNKKSLTN